MYGFTSVLYRVYTYTPIWIRTFRMTFGYLLSSMWFSCKEPTKLWHQHDAWCSWETFETNNSVTTNGTWADMNNGWVVLELWSGFWWGFNWAFDSRECIVTVDWIMHYIWQFLQRYKRRPDTWNFSIVVLQIQQGAPSRSKTKCLYWERFNPFNFAWFTYDWSRVIPLVS